MKNGKLRDKFVSIDNWLRSILIEREEEVQGCMIALVAGEHVFLVGPPGTAKSLLAECICNSIVGAKYFGILMNKFTVPEELFGPISIKKMDEQDVYERKVESMLPEADIAFLDEIWKANSAINNTLLRVTNERIYKNGTKESKVPLKTMFCASNEFPEGDELGAIYDRLALKFCVHYVSDESFLQLMSLKDIDPTSGPKITVEEMEDAKAEAMAIDIPEDVRLKLKEMRVRLMAENVVVSDRKWRQAEKLIKASAFLRGNKEVVVQDLSILKDVLWKTEQQIATVMSTVLDIADPTAKIALELSNEFRSVVDNATYNTQDECAEAISKIKTIGKKVKVAIADNPKSTVFQTLLDRINQTLKDISDRLVGAEVRR